MTVTWTSPPSACFLTASISAVPPTVSFATTSSRFIRSPPPAAAASGFLSSNTACCAPGMPYSYGPPTTVGTLSKLKTGGGEDTCHSIVCARHGLAAAFGPCRHDEIML